MDRLRADIQEYEGLGTEIERLRKEARKLEKRRSELSGQIVRGLEELRIRQVTVNGATYGVVERHHHDRLNKKTKMANLGILLERGNVSPKELLNAQQGKEHVVKALKKVEQAQIKSNVPFPVTIRNTKKGLGGKGPV